MPNIQSEAEFVCLSYREQPIQRVKHQLKRTFKEWLTEDNIIVRIFLAIQNAQLKRAQKIIHTNNYYL